MENGLMERKKDMVSGQVAKEIHTLVNGRRVRLMGMECMYGKMEIDMKESGSYV